jgi:hypothetical protein
VKALKVAKKGNVKQRDFEISEGEEGGNTGQRQVTKAVEKIDQWVGQAYRNRNKKLKTTRDMMLSGNSWLSFVKIQKQQNKINQQHAKTLASALKKTKK